MPRKPTGTLFYRICKRTFDMAQFPLALAKVGAVMLAAAFHTSRHYILFTALVCLCVLLGGCFAGAAGLIAPAMA